MDWNELPLQPRHLGVPSGAFKMISGPMVRSAHTMHLCCTDINTISKWTETRIHMAHSPRSFTKCVQHDFRAYGMFSTNHAPILCQDEHYLQTDSNELHLSLVTKEYHRVRPKWFSSLWYVAQTMHQSCVKISTISKRNEMSLTIGCIQINFLSVW
jgi:hypothetical protein